GGYGGRKGWGPAEGRNLCNTTRPISCKPPTKNHRGQLLKDFGPHGRPSRVCGPLLPSVKGHLWKIVLAVVQGGALISSRGEVTLSEGRSCLLQAVWVTFTTRCSQL